MNETLLSVIIAICVILLPFVLFFIYKLGKSSKRTILITGVCDSGKTVIYSRLVLDEFKNTHTSIKENVSDYTTKKGKTVQLVDIPGHERLRSSFLDKYKGGAKALIFVVDSSTYQKDIRDVADYFYSLLIDPEIYSNCKNVLVFCNKQDNPTAKGAGVIKTVLEKELNTVRQTKSHSLESIEGSSNASTFLGSPASDFTFEQLWPVVVDFENGSAVDGDSANIEGLTKWLDAVA